MNNIVKHGVRPHGALELIQHTLDNGNTIVYKVVNGTAYHVSTDANIVGALERYRSTRHSQPGRLILDYGDVETGQSWGDIYDIAGYIGRSGGDTKIPILLHNSRSRYGGAVLDHCIVRILTAKGKRVLYQHPTYTPAVNR